jgi:hypothetical protein
MVAFRLAISLTKRKSAGICWYLLVSAGICWYLLVSAGICWYLLVSAGICWYLLCESLVLQTGSLVRPW